MMISSLPSRTFNFKKEEELGFSRMEPHRCHTAEVSMRVVRELFPCKVISSFGDINWPLRSSDLPPMDSFVWGYLKRKVYINPLVTLLQLKVRIRQEMQAIPQALCRKVFADALSVQLFECKRHHGQHLNEVIHHKQFPYGVL